MCLLATDNEAIAETVSASSVSRRRASLKEHPSVEAERCSERQYLPTKDQDRVKVYIRTSTVLEHRAIEYPMLSSMLVSMKI